MLHAAIHLVVIEHVHYHVYHFGTNFKNYEVNQILPPILILVLCDNFMEKVRCTYQSWGSFYPILSNAYRQGKTPKLCSWANMYGVIMQLRWSKNYGDVLIMLYCVESVIKRNSIRIYVTAKSVIIWYAEEFPVCYLDKDICLFYIWWAVLSLSIIHCGHFCSITLAQ